jgi:hypothetical protein
MSLLDKRNSVIIGLILVLISSCDQDEKTINVNLKGVTNTSYAEFTIPTSEIFIDSLRTDDSDYILVGDYEDPILGLLSAEAYFEIQYDSGAIIADTLSLDSVVFKLKIQDQLMENNSAFFNMDLLLLRDSLFSEAVYLAAKKLMVDKAIQNVAKTVLKSDSVLTFSGMDLGYYLYGKLKGLEQSDQYGFRSEFAFLPAAENEALMSFNLASEDTKILIYSKDPNDSLFVTQLRFNGIHFTQLERDKSNTDLAGVSNLDSLQLADEYSIINPLQGLFTMLDFSEVMLFLNQLDNFILNSVELEVGLTAASIDPILDVNFYTFNAHGGIDGNVFASLNLVTQGNLDYVSTFNQAANDFILSEESFIAGAGALSPLVSKISELNYNPVITLALEDQYIRKAFYGEDPFEKLVMISDDRLTLNQSLVKKGSVMVKIYYTQSK